MKIICSDQHLSTLKSLLRDYLYLDIVLVEKGYDYEGLCYYFSMDHLDELIQYLNQSHEYILCYQGERMPIGSGEQIIYIEGYSKEAFIYTETMQFVTHQKLYELETILEPYHFARVNKSMIVNIYEIDSFIPDVQRRYIIVLKNQQRILLTRSYVKSFMEKLRRKAL